MKEYIITIIGATLLSAMAGIIAPEKWRSYVQVITGLVIISCIISPVTAIVKSDIFDGFDSVQENIPDSSNMQTELVIEELKNRINEDIKARMEKEFKLSVEKAKTLVNSCTCGIETSCYSCLRNYSNQNVHTKLRREGAVKFFE